MYSCCTLLFGVGDLDGRQDLDDPDEAEDDAERQIEQADNGRVCFPGLVLLDAEVGLLDHDAAEGGEEELAELHEAQANRRRHDGDREDETKHIREDGSEEAAERDVPEDVAERSH